MKNGTNKKTKTKKYRTHPIVGACLLLTLLISALAVGGAYLVFKYAEGTVSEYETRMQAAGNEAFLSFCEYVEESDFEGAASELCRYGLFSDKSRLHMIETVERAFLSGLSDAEKEAVCRVIAENKSADEVIRELSLIFEEKVGESLSAAVPYGKNEWIFLKERGEVTASEARDVAARFIGGGVTLTMAEDHTFPLIYVFGCQNATSEVTRMGGRLIRMWIYREGKLGERSDDACRCAAREFIHETGIADAYLLHEEKRERRIDYVFCGVGRIGDETALYPDERIEVSVNVDGARISAFDASLYYRFRGAYTSPKKPSVSRADAILISDENGMNGADIRLLCIGGELFWRASGGKMLYINAENGEVTVQNP